MKLLKNTIWLTVNRVWQPATEMKLRKNTIWLTVNGLGVPPPWASRKWKEPAFLLTIVDTLIFPLVDIIVTAFHLDLLMFKKEFYLYVNLAIGLISGGLIEEMKVRCKKNYPKI